jgi:hypothetical protein
MKKSFIDMTHAGTVPRVRRPVQVAPSAVADAAAD